MADNQEHHQKTKSTVISTQIKRILKFIGRANVFNYIYI